MYCTSVACTSLYLCTYHTWLDGRSAKFIVRRPCSGDGRSHDESDGTDEASRMDISTKLFRGTGQMHNIFRPALASIRRCIAAFSPSSCAIPAESAMHSDHRRGSQMMVETLPSSHPRSSGLGDRGFFDTLIRRTSDFVSPRISSIRRNPYETVRNCTKLLLDPGQGSTSDHAGLGGNRSSSW
jgi:hypothetical protein